MYDTPHRIPHPPSVAPPGHRWMPGHGGWVLRRVPAPWPVGYRPPTPVRPPLVAPMPLSRRPRTGMSPWAIVALVPLGVVALWVALCLMVIGGWVGLPVVGAYLLIRNHKRLRSRKRTRQAKTRARGLPL